ncbi:Alkyl hydroperoxide reductase AhpD [Stieleria neptunia]|uniref:Alkyl hydroperoxide reductase AhpD n=1 Tax=Stieleria neptunia TaxID=2527979 RepID=A0A518HHS0_9BACT|nr:carboxymuconolactone decarboxylase family protein [Stieleria neptunia]QDV40388.1 Alkyl hydroperoxide reductase AhpD [Stieleria neptunia]
MPRLNVIAPDQATGPLKETYDGITKKMGKVVNIFQGMGNSPAALNAYLSMSDALAQGELAAEERELVYLAVSEGNGCNYCVSAHTMIATKQVGVSESETLKARRFQSSDKKHAALLAFVRKVIETKGFVEDDDLNDVRQAGYSDGQLAEAIGYIGLATFSNLFNHVHDTPLDFPQAPKL